MQTWGPPGDRWHYDHSTKHYDLCRESDKELTIATTAGPKGTTIAVAPELSALVIVDMQNFFLDSKLIENPLGLKAIDPIISVIRRCRAVGIQVGQGLSLCVEVLCGSGRESQFQAELRDRSSGSTGVSRMTILPTCLPLSDGSRRR